jgi:hypothetical protein
MIAMTLNEHKRMRHETITRAVEGFINRNHEHSNSKSSSACCLAMARQMEEYQNDY